MRRKKTVKGPGLELARAKPKSTAKFAFVFITLKNSQTALSLQFTASQFHLPKSQTFIWPIHMSVISFSQTIINTTEQTWLQ